MTAAEVADRAGARPYRGGWRGLCPVHGGRSGTAFEVRQGVRGVLVRCWRGCPAAEILAALGLKWSDLFSGPRGPRPTDRLGKQRHKAVQQVREDARRHPALRHIDELAVILADERHSDEAIARALSLAIMGRAVQVAAVEGEGCGGN